MSSPRDPLSVPLPLEQLEQYAHAFDDRFHTRIQRQRFREYLVGLLLPRDRHKTLTALVGAEPITQAQTAPVQQLQFFLSEADWGAEAVTTRQIELLRSTPLTTPHAQGALVIAETGDRKDGTKMERRWNEDGTKMERRWNEDGACRLSISGLDRQDRHGHCRGE
jgi:hypothetical protein